MKIIEFPRDPTDNEAVIRHLEQLLEDAKANKLTKVVWCAVDEDDLVYTGWCGIKDRIYGLGMAEQIKADMSGY